MLLAAFFGGLAASALLVGALLAYGLRPSPRLTAVVMAVGSGLLIGSVAYDLVAVARVSVPVPLIAVSLTVGAGVFVLGNKVIERRGGARRKDPTGSATPSDNPLGIVLGSVLDGVPESFVLGLSVLHGGVSVPLLFGIGMSNLPEGMAASSGLRIRGWKEAKVVRLWSIVIVTSAISAALGHELLAADDGTLTGLVQTFAAGALLAMVADTMVPEAYEVERTWTGGLVVVGFAASLMIASLIT
ncbi:MAG: ZIP family zinc transporter [Actinobacteria bacterium]|nr:ZIP family zinc transporter [Actinomycetota bacterium]